MGRGHAAVRQRVAFSAGCAFIVGAAICGEPAGAITLEAFGRSAAATAYREGRFGAALAELDAMLRREPRDAILLRVRGMALYRLKRLDEAEAALAAAVVAAPGDPAAQYWLGATRFERGNARGALVAFATVERMAPNSRYGASAREFIAAIQSAGGHAGTAARERPWTLSVTAGGQYDDNVSLVNSSRLGSWRFFAETEGRYTIALPGNLALALDGRAFGSGHFRTGADNFNLVSLTGGPTLIWTTALAGRNLRLSFGYAYEHVREAARFYSDSHALTARAETTLLPNSITAAAFTFAIDRFALVTGADPALFSRDGQRYAASLRHIHYLPGRRHYVWAGYEFTQYATEGRNFDAYAHAGAAGASVALPWDLRLDLGAELGYTRYFDYADSPKRRALKQTYTAWLTKAFTPNLTMSLAYAYTFEDSNIRDFETRRNLFTVSARYAF